MKIIKKQGKVKSKEDIENRENWAVIEHEGTPKLKAGKYRICPVCLYPEYIPDPKEVISNGNQKDDSKKRS